MKTKWFKLGIPISHIALVGVFQENSFHDTVTNGFELIDYNEATITAKFIEKNVIKENIVDPFGNENFIEFIRYDILDITLQRIENNYYFLIIEHPPRSIKFFINKLYELIGLGIFLTDLSIDIIKFIEFLKEEYGYHTVKIQSIKAGGVYISDKTSITLEAISNGDIFRDLTNTFDMASSIFFTKAKILIPSPITMGVQTKIEITKKGSISFSDFSINEILKIIKKL